MNAPMPPPPIYAAPPAQRHTSGLAIASLVLGLMFIAGIGSILAVVFGVKARHEIDASNGWVTGRGMATAGVILGWIGVAIVALGVLAAAAN